jgi:hypothetical protein
MKYKTILSGALNTFDTSIPDSVYHVVIAAGNMVVGSGASADTARLDGFTVTGGSAKFNEDYDKISVNSQNISRYFGGGIYISGASPVIVNDSIAGNVASVGGGIMLEALESGGTTTSPKILNTYISNNKADKGDGCHGAGIHMNSGSSVFTRVVISGNIVYGTGEGSGAGVNITGGAPVFTNVLISGNTISEGRGGGVYISGVYISADIPEFINVTITGNYSAYGDYNGGLYTHNNIKLRNTLVWGNTPGYKTAFYTSIETLNAHNTLIQGDDLTFYRWTISTV